MINYFRERYLATLDSDGMVSLGSNEYVKSEVYEGFAPNDFEADLGGWVVDQQEQARERVRALLDDNGCLARFNILAERHRGGQVLPFVGAGLSVPSGFPLWGDFLDRVAAMGNAKLAAEVVKRKKSGDYEGAAQSIADRLNENMLSEQVEAYFSRSDYGINGPVQLLPHIFGLGCVTTNFDNVLERAFTIEGRAFVDVLAGHDVLAAPRKAANSKHVLFKLHGEADDPANRVLTTTEYDQAYGNRRSMEQMLKYLITNRSVLFMGCNLTTDRTITELKKIKAANELGAPRHYAFLKDPGQEARQERWRELDEAEIHPIWYPVKDPETDHDTWVEDLLVALDGGPL